MEEPNPFLAELEPVRRLSLRRGPFFEGAIDERQHLVRNPECRRAARVGGARARGGLQAAPRSVRDRARARRPGVKLARAVQEFDPVLRMCLCKREFDLTAATPSEFLQRNPESLVIILEPLTDDGLRSTAISARMADVDVLRWWISIVREEAFAMHEGAWSTDPDSGRRMHVPDHRHMQGAHDLAAGGVRMLAAAGSAVFEFDDLA